MRYCQECGVEVALTDAFCANCGIALASVEVENLPKIDEKVNFETDNAEQAVIDMPASADVNDGVENPQDWWTKTDEISISSELKQKESENLPTIEKYTQFEKQSDVEKVEENEIEIELSESAEIQDEVQTEKSDEDEKEKVEISESFQNTVQYSNLDLEQLKIESGTEVVAENETETLENSDNESIHETKKNITETESDITEQPEVLTKNQTEVEEINPVSETLQSENKIEENTFESETSQEISEEEIKAENEVEESINQSDVVESKIADEQLEALESTSENSEVIAETQDENQAIEVFEESSEEVIKEKSESFDNDESLHELSPVIDENKDDISVAESENADKLQQNEEKLQVDDESDKSLEDMAVNTEKEQVTDRAVIEISEETHLNDDEIELTDEENSLLENLAPVAGLVSSNQDNNLCNNIQAKEVVHDIQNEVSENLQSEENNQEKDNSQDGRSYTNPINQGNDTGGKKTKLQPLAEGIVLNNRYEIIRKIGGGGMGAVYLASDKNLGGVLRAVKEMVQSYIEEDAQEKAVLDFKRESLLLTSLDHPSIPTIFDYFLDEKESRFYLVMKYISGGDLGSRLRSAPEGKIDEKTVTEWAIQVADVIDYLHRHEPPIVYRDLKPSNVMIDGNSGRIMLIDFGIARWVNKEEKGVTAVGTMGYAPPELFGGNVEPRSDIYSLGSTMFHLLTGADPQNNPLLIFDFNKNPRPRQINSQISDQMEQILMRSVEYNVEGRFSSAAEFREVLIAHLDAIRTGRLTFGVTQGVSATPFVGTQLVFCGFCGQKIVGSDMFCPFCGAKQPQAQGSTPLPSFDTPKLTAKLLVISTNDLDAPTYGLDKDSNLLGRRDPMSNIFPEVDLSKYDPQTKISRRHARIWREVDTFMIEDLGSSNGTVLISTVNEMNKLLPHTPKVLTHGDKVKLGDTILHFVVG